MIVTIKTQGLQTMEQIRAFLEGTRPLGFEAPAREDLYVWLTGELRRLGYLRLGKADKGLVRRYLERVSGLSRAQLTRLIQQFRETGSIRDRRGKPAKPFPRRYTDANIRLLAEVDALHINLVDEVTQFQFIGSVERISERFLLPVLKALFQAFPFKIHGFHSDNGSEYVNKRVAGLLAKLHVQEFTKSRPRRSNDHALLESKNGSVVRKHLGYAHIPGHFPQQVNRFTQNVLPPYLNFHRPCFFPSEEVDDKDRIRKRYRYDQMMTPYEKLKSLPEAVQHLKPGITFETLDDIAHAMSDNAAARRLNNARAKLFRNINKAQNPAA